MRRTMNKLTQGATRLLVLALGLGLVSTGWATDYKYSNVDSDTLAVASDGLYSINTTLSFTLNNPSEYHATSDFPSSGYVQLTSISIAARSNNADQTATTATLTKNGSTESYSATVTYSDDPGFTAYGPDSWTRREVRVTFGTDGVLVDTTATYTLTFAAKTGCSAVRKGSNDWMPTVRIFGRTPSGSMEMPSSLIPSSGGMTLPSTVTVADATGISFASDSVTIGNSGLQIALQNTLQTQTVMVKAIIPSSSSRLIAWKVSDAIEAYTSYTGSQFEQHFLNNGSVWGTTYGTSAWTRDASEHWLAVAYDRGSDTSTYLDGANKITNDSLKWSSLNTSKVTIGGTAYNTTDSAVGMVVKDVQIYNQSLGSQRIATVTAALNKGWTVDAAGTTLTSTTLRELPNDANVKVAGSLSVATDGTCSLVSATTVQVLAGGSLDIGTTRPTIAGIASTGTLAVTPTGATVSQQIEGYEATVNLTVTGDLDGTVTLGGNTVTPVVVDGTATLTSVMSANPTYTGDSWWWDYEFNGTVTSIGSDKGGMTTESSSAPIYYNSTELYFQQTPWRDASFNDKSELTAVMYCAPGNYANTVLVGFGSTTAAGKKAIALVTGANPAAGEMKLVLTDGTTVTSLADLTAVGATTTKHLYAFVMDRITENETSKTRIRVYLDGKVKAIYKHNGTLTLSNGFQIGSLHGGVVGGLTKYSSTGNSGTLDFLRVVDGTLTDGAMSALAGAYPYNSAYGKATRAPVSSAANWVATDVWTQTVPGQADATQEAPNQDTNATLSKDGSSDVSVAINLQSDSNYESLTLTKEAGATGSLKLTSGVGNITSGKLITAETSVLVDTTVPAGRVHLGVTSIADGTTLTVDPVTTVISDAMSSLGFGEVYEDVVISMALLGNGASVVLDPAGVSTLAGYGFTAELVYNSSNLSYTFKLTREEATADIEVSIASDGTATWATRSIAVPAPASLPSTYAGTVTITSAAENPVTIATAFAGGNVTVASGGPVTLSGAITTSGTVALNSATTLSGNTVSSALTGSGAVTINDTVTIADGGSIANTINGSGTIDCSGRSSKPGAFTFGTWTGTVVLPELASIAGDTFSFNNYGIEGSTVRVNGIGGGWLKSEEVNPTIDIPATKTITISDFSASFVNTFKALSGAGTFAVTYNTAIDTTSGSWYSNYSAYFLIKNISNFTGSLTTATPGIVIGSAKPEYRTTGGKIILTTSATIATGKTWTATDGIVLADAAATLTNTDGALDPAPTTTVANSYVKLTDSTYSVDAYNTVSFTVENATYTRTDALGNAIKDGDTITFTVTPDANYGVSSVTATSGEVTNDDGTYSYVVTSDATITIGIVRTHVQLTIPAVEHATAAVTVGGEAATGSSPYTVPYQSNVTVTWTPASGYKITAGASQTINSIAADTTADSPTVEAKGATVSGVTFDYGKDFATATVAATVSGDATAYTLTVGGTDYAGTVDGTTVTFSDVVTGHSSAYDSVSYEITATDGTSSVVVSGGSGAAPVADVTAGWINENATTHGLAAAGGAWTNAEAVSYSEGKAAISDNRFAATTASTASRVVLEFNVCFSSTSEDDVSGEAQAAIKLGAVNDATTFMVLTTGNTWTPVSNAELPIDASATYDVVLAIDYGTSTYKVDVEGKSLTNSAGVASFSLATNKAAVQNIDFVGSGTLTSMKGDQLEGYMVVDKNGTRYVSIAAAISAYLNDPTIAPLTVLHDGTAPSGWKIVTEGGVDILKKIAKGLFFMAY